jgi:AcrR family transcriptional regulator
MPLAGAIRFIMKIPPKERILRHATRLFYDEGFSTGIDTILKESKVAKMSLYHHFKSKEVLICSVLGAVRSTLAAHLEDVEKHHSTQPKRKLVSVFDAICNSFTDPQLRAGLFNRALAEFPASRLPANRTAAAMKYWIITVLERLCRECWQDVDHNTLAVNLMLLADGAYCLTPVLGVSQSCSMAHSLAEQLLATIDLEERTRHSPTEEKSV